jgi:hypothetical protein
MCSDFLYEILIYKIALRINELYFNKQEYFSFKLFIKFRLHFIICNEQLNEPLSHLKL